MKNTQLKALKRETARTKLFVVKGLKFEMPFNVVAAIARGLVLSTLSVTDGGANNAFVFPERNNIADYQRSVRLLASSTKPGNGSSRPVEIYITGRNWVC